MTLSRRTPLGRKVHLQSKSVLRSSTELARRRRLRVLGKKGRQLAAADRAWAKAVKERDEHTCRRCGSVGDVQAHHVATRRRRPDLRHELSNGLSLCQPCHRHVHEHPLESVEAGFLSYEVAA